MANRIYIIPRRNDLSGLGLGLLDLKPNAGQKNSIYDGEHQNVYVQEMLDPAGATVVSGNTYVSGSLSTTLTTNAVADSTTGGGDDVNAMQVCTFGLAAYIKDRVHRGGLAGAGNPEMAFAECNAAAVAIRAVVEAGTSLTEPIISAILAAVVAQTNLITFGLSKSFGTVADILRICSGEVYKLPALTIIENVAGQFQDLAARQVFITAMTPALIASQGQFYASGSFLTATETAYRARPQLALTGAVNLSLVNGVLAHYKDNMTIINSNNYAYAAADVTAWKVRAQDITGTAIATTGIHPAIAVYDQDGNVL